MYKWNYSNSGPCGRTLALGLSKLAPIGESQLSLMVLYSFILWPICTEPQDYSRHDLYLFQYSFFLHFVFLSLFFKFCFEIIKLYFSLSFSQFCRLKQISTIHLRYSKMSMQMTKMNTCKVIGVLYLLL